MPRKQKKYHFIYKTTNLINNKFYVGMHSTDDLDDGYVGSGKRLWYSINKYGIENHKVEILELLDSRESLKKREAEIIDEDMITDALCMNLKLGGEGGWSSISGCQNGGKIAGKIKHTSSISSRNCEALRDLNVRDKARTSLKETLAKKKLEGYDSFWACREKVLTDETKKKRKETFNEIKHQQGESNSQFGTCWICNDDGNVKKVKKENLQSWLDLGWRKGRK